jgi:hypothetical protein
MADNVAVTPGSGVSIASDDIGGVQHQRVKIEFGVDGSATDVSTTNPLPTSLTNLEKSEDSAHSSGDKGIMSLAVRKDTDSSLGADNDYSPIQVNKDGKLKTISNNIKIISVSKTRPANTTQYAVGDVVEDNVTDSFVFTNVVQNNGGSGYIMEAMLIDSANQSTKLLCDLWLFSVVPTVPDDNVTFGISDSELLKLVAVVQLSENFTANSAAGASGNTVFSSRIPPTLFSCDSASTSLFGVLVANNTYTPVSGESFTVFLKILQE